MDDNKSTSSTKRAKSRSHYRDIADKKTAYSYFKSLKMIM